MFTVEERDRVRDRVLEIAAADERVVAAAIVGSLADGGDRWSDLDLTFAVADGIPLREVIDAFTRSLDDEFDAVQLLDLTVGARSYRVFLLPRLLQVDLSFTAAADFKQVSPQFKIVFGAYSVDFAPPQSADDVFGWGVLWARNTHVCVERQEWWEAEYDASALRDAALTLACLRRGLPTGYGRSFDELPSDVLDAAEDALVRSLDRDELLRALAAGVRLLLREADDVREVAAKVEPQLIELTHMR
ncbi:MAG TPA: hypothetical protein VG144_05260 [Gaiellaceae bacterium]|nr:hypothetical protein [Gaiellaceae bacterium]